MVTISVGINSLASKHFLLILTKKNCKMTKVKACFKHWVFFNVFSGIIVVYFRDGGSESVSVNIGIFWGYRYRLGSVSVKIINITIVSVSVNIGIFWGYWYLGIGKNNTDPPSLVYFIENVYIG